MLDIFQWSKRLKYGKRITAMPNLFANLIVTYEYMDLATVPKGYSINLKI